MASIEDLDILSNYKFHIIVRNKAEYVGSSGSLTIHQLIMGKAPKDFCIDHIRSIIKEII